MASVLMRQERASHTLQPTAIVSEAFVRLAHRNPGEFDTVSNLLAVAAHAMRCVLVDHARTRGAAKRGAAKRMGDAALAFVAADTVDPADVFAIDEALTELAEMDERAARVLECKVFAGMTVSEISEALGPSWPRSSESSSRKWKTAWTPRVFAVDRPADRRCSGRCRSESAYSVCREKVCREEVCREKE
jgi:RNA polymerase sigma factor (TIGR02999 family)